MSWLRDMLGTNSSAHRHADRAIGLSNEVINSSRGLREQLEPYRRESDPFAAVAVNTRIARVFEERVEQDTPRAKP